MTPAAVSPANVQLPAPAQSADTTSSTPASRSVAYTPAVTPFASLATASRRFPSVRPLCSVPTNVHVCSTWASKEYVPCLTLPSISKVPPVMFGSGRSTPSRSFTIVVRSRRFDWVSVQANVRSGRLTKASSEMPTFSASAARAYAAALGTNLPSSLATATRRAIPSIVRRPSKSDHGSSPASLTPTEMPWRLSGLRARSSDRFSSRSGPTSGKPLPGSSRLPRLVPFRKPGSAALSSCLTGGSPTLKDTTPADASYMYALIGIDGGVGSSCCRAPGTKAVPTASTGAGTIATDEPVELVSSWSRQATSSPNLSSYSPTRWVRPESLVFRSRSCGNARGFASSPSSGRGSWK